MDENTFQNETPSNNPPAMSIYEIATALEQGKMDPSLQDPEVVIECALIYQSRRYPISQIASILKVCTRTVSRYVAEARKKNAIKPNPHFQDEFVGNTLNNLSAQQARLIRWSYSDKLSEADKIRAIQSACQIQKYGVELMERLGYLTRKNTEFSIKSELMRKIKEQPDQIWMHEPQWVIDLDLLSHDQLSIALCARFDKEEEMNGSMGELVSSLIKENKSKPFEFSPEDIDFDVLGEALLRNNNCDRIILEQLGITGSQYNMEQPRAFTAEQVVAAFNGALYMPKFMNQINLKVFPDEFSMEARLLISKLSGNPSKKRHEILNLNARLLTEFYPDAIRDSYREKLILMEKKFGI